MPGTPSIEVQLAILVTEMGHIKGELVDAKSARHDQWQKMQEQSSTLSKMDNRLESVEESLAKSAPTIEEFITIKHKVVGAGAIGKWIWVAATAILTMIATLAAAKTGLLSLFGK